jgi:hypothetical protein
MMQLLWKPQIQNAVTFFKEDVDIGVKKSAEEAATIT